jgi:hypothetical protein
LRHAVIPFGGTRINSRGPDASAIALSRFLHSARIVGGCRITESGRPLLATDGTPVTRILFFPAAQCEILDTWYSIGLRGTGSHDGQRSIRAGPPFGVVSPSRRPSRGRSMPCRPSPLRHCAGGGPAWNCAPRDRLGYDACRYQNREPNTARFTKTQRCMPLLAVPKPCCARLGRSSTTLSKRLGRRYAPASSSILPSARSCGWRPRTPRTLRRKPPSSCSAPAGQPRRMRAT